MTLLDERPATADHTPDFAGARQAMIDSQLRVSGVTEGFVLAAMNRVAREDFVPPAARDAAYIDRAIPLGEGKFLAAPLVHGMMLREAAPRATDKALLVGEGYLAALLAPLVASLDSVAPAGAAPRRKKAAYDLIVIDGAVEELPDSLAAQLAEGGRLVTGIVTRGMTRLAVGRKLAGTIALQPLAEIGIPILPHFAAPKRWSF